MIEKSFILGVPNKRGGSLAEAEKGHRDSLLYPYIGNVSSYSASPRRFMVESSHTSDIWRRIYVPHRWSSGILDNIP